MTNSETPQPNIEHIVLSGGGVCLFSIYGTLRESAKAGFWHKDNIKTLWSTSAGSIIAGFILLTNEWDMLDDYLIRRPWEKVFPINLHTLMNAYIGCGLFSTPVVEQMFAPLLLSRDFSTNITLEELYEKTGIEFHLFSTEINLHQCVDISHITHPNWRFTDAIYASCALPGLFAPLVKGENTYTDGSFFCHYPLKPCLDRCGGTSEKVFGVVKHITPGVNSKLTTDSTLLDFVGKISYLLFLHFLEKQTKMYVNIPYEIDLGVRDISIEGIKLAISCQDERRSLIEVGVNAWKTRAFFTTDIV